MIPHWNYCWHVLLTANPAQTLQIIFQLYKLRLVIYMFGFTFWKCQYLYRQVNYKIPTLKLMILLTEFFHILIVPCDFSTSMEILCLYFVYQSYSCWFFNVSSKIVAFIFESTKAPTQGCSLKKFFWNSLQNLQHETYDGELCRDVFRTKSSI